MNEHGNTRLFEDYPFGQNRLDMWGDGFIIIRGDQGRIMLTPDAAVDLYDFLRRQLPGIHHPGRSDGWAR